MKDLDHMNIFNELSKNGNHGKLALLDAPTGSGKSYSIVIFLCKLALKDKNFKAFFVTDQKKNLLEQEFKDQWEKQRELSSNDGMYFYQKIAVLRSLTDTIRLLIDDFENKKIPKCILTKKVTKELNSLKRTFDLYKTLQSENTDSMSGWSDLKKSEFSFRKELAKAIVDSSKMDVEDYDFNDYEFQKSVKKKCFNVFNRISEMDQ